MLFVKQRILLKKNSIPIPEHVIFTYENLLPAYSFLEKHPLGCVLKPTRGYGGKGVSTHIQSKSELQKAVVLASIYDNTLIIEPHIIGECFRLLVIDGKMVHAVKRCGVTIRGDGHSTIEKIIGSTSVIDRDCLVTLAKQNLNLSSVLPSGECAMVKSSRHSCDSREEVRTVYDEDVTSSICEKIICQAETISTLLKSRFLGIDVITKDITQPLEETGGIFNEVNTTPALHHHYDITKQKFPDPALLAIRTLLK